VPGLSTGELIKELGRQYGTDDELCYRAGAYRRGGHGQTETKSRKLNATELLHDVWKGAEHR